MRGIQQETKRIPHHYTHGVAPVTGAWHRVTLRPDAGVEDPCKPAATLTEAYKNAEEHLRSAYPGASL
jgi:hypothetical protein